MTTRFEETTEDRPAATRLRTGEQRFEEPATGARTGPDGEPSPRAKRGRQMLFGLASIAAHLGVPLAVARRAICDMPVCQLPQPMALQTELDEWLAADGAEVLRKLREPKPKPVSLHTRRRIEKARQKYMERHFAHHRKMLRREMRQ